MNTKNALSGNIITGLLFSMLWASASVAGKFGIYSAEPLVLFNIRFFIAGIILLAYIYGIQQQRLPRGIEWKQLAIFGAFNTTLYLGFFIIALQHIMPGITSLAIALNPLLIGIISALWTRRNIRATEWVSIALGIIGVVVAAYPLLINSYATPFGLSLLALSMISYSFGSVYYTTVTWSLSRLTINAWQVFIAAILLIPFTLIMHKHENHFDTRFWLSILWLIFPVSILAVQLWLRLLRTDAVRASLWLYLCPVFGFLYSGWLLNEPITAYTFVGTAFVMIALYVGQRKKTNP